MRRVQTRLRLSQLAAVVGLAAAIDACSVSLPAAHSPNSPRPATAGAAKMIGLSFNPTELTYSGGSHKVYVIEVFREWGATCALSLSEPGQAAARLADSIIDHDNYILHIAVNDRLKRGYAVVD
jgi:hypothetical protein